MCPAPILTPLWPPCEPSPAPLAAKGQGTQVGNKAVVVEQLRSPACNGTPGADGPKWQPGAAGPRQRFFADFDSQHSNDSNTAPGAGAALAQRLRSALRRLDQSDTATLTTQRLGAALTQRLRSASISACAKYSLRAQPREAQRLSGSRSAGRCHQKGRAAQWHLLARGSRLRNASTAQHDTAWHSTAKHDTPQHSTAGPAASATAG